MQKLLFPLALQSKSWQSNFRPFFSLSSFPSLVCLFVALGRSWLENNFVCPSDLLSGIRFSITKFAVVFCCFRIYFFLCLYSDCFPNSFRPMRAFHLHTTLERRTNSFFMPIILASFACSTLHLPDLERDLYPSAWQGEKELLYEFCRIWDVLSANLDAVFGIHKGFFATLGSPWFCFLIACIIKRIALSTDQLSIHISIAFLFWLYVALLPSTH